MQTIPFTEIRDRLAETIRTIEATQEPLILSRRDKAKAVLMSYAQYQRLTAPTFDLGAAIAEWRADFGPRPGDPDDDDPYAHVRDRSPERPFRWPE